MDKAREFFKALRTDPQIQELLSKKPHPETIAEAYEIYAEIAESMGYSLTTEQIRAAGETLTQEQKTATAQAEETVQQIDMDVLDQVAGGGSISDSCKKHHHVACDSTYEDGEWCWFSDACETAISGYAGYP